MAYQGKGMKALDILVGQVVDAAPKSLLIVGRDPTELAGAVRAAMSGCPVEPVKLEGVPALLAGNAKYDMAILIDALEHLDKVSGERLVGALRDLHCTRLLVAIQALDLSSSPVWGSTDFIALGLEMVTLAPAEVCGLHLYRFDIRTYKTTPDWLNSRYWAHPELWGKKWW